MVATQINERFSVTHTLKKVTAKHAQYIELPRVRSRHVICEQVLDVTISKCWSKNYTDNINHISHWSHNSVTKYIHHFALLLRRC